jgi:hypothetical protein
MPINPNIALGVQPIQQTNMLGQVGQMMALKSASQDIQGNEALRDFYASGGDAKTPEGIRALMAANPKMGMQILKNQSEMSARDIETQNKSLKSIKDNVSLVNSREGMVDFLTGAYSTPGGALLAKLVPLDKAIATIPTDPKAFEDYKRNLGLTSEKLFESSDARLSSRTSLATAGMAANTAANRLGFDERKFKFEQDKPIGTVTGEDGYLYNKMPDGTVRQVMMGGAPVPAVGNAPPVAGGGVGGGGSVNALAQTTGTSVNAFNAPVVQPSASNQPFKPKPTGPMVSINNVEPASETALKQYMKTASDTHNSLKQAPSVLQNIEDAKRLVADAKGFMGTGGETMLNVTKFLNNRLGTNINTDGVKSAEELNTRLFMGILDNLKKLDSQPSQSQQEAMKQALGNLGTDPNAMNNVLDVFGDILRNKVDIYNQEVTDAEARGVKFPYKPQINLKPKTPASSGDIATDPVIKSLLDKYK